MKEKDEISVRICGIGGQGVVLAGNILAEALLHGYAYAANSSSYGPEVRGTSVRSDVIGSRRWVDYPRADCPDWVIALAQKVYDTGAGDFSADAVVLYDPALVMPSEQCPARHVGIPASQTCLENFGDAVNANLAMLGALAALGAVSEKDITAAVTSRLKGAEKAGAAIRIGCKLAKGL